MLQQFLDIRLNCRRFGNGCEPLNRAAVGIQKEFREIPFDPASEKPAQAAFEQPKDGMCLRPVDIDLFEKWKGYAKVQLADLFYVRVALGFLPRKLVARESKDDKTLLPVFCIELLKSLELRCKSALCGGVYYQDDFAFIPGHADWPALRIVGR